MSELAEMVAAFNESSIGVFAPSEFWKNLNRRHLEQLESDGYDNFKRTLALNYFTWAVLPWNPQVRFLATHVPPLSLVRSAVRAVTAGRHASFSWPKSLSYNFLTYALHEYVGRTVAPAIREGLSEPTEGNPPRVCLGGHLISQDLSNSVLEYASITDGLTGRDLHTVMELGAGYGRTAFVFLKKLPAVRYWVVDIPPALYVCQRYLSSQFPARKIFRFRRFTDYRQVGEELESSEIAFLLPSQIHLLPARCIDLFINISSLHEMRRDQIDYFFAEIDRLTRGHFYSKQWKVSRVPFDNIVTREEDYPVRASWRRRFRRQCPVQETFFEAMYRTGA